MYRTQYIQYIGLLEVKATLQSEAVTLSPDWHWTHQSRHMVGPLVCADHYNFTGVRSGDKNGEMRAWESSVHPTVQHVFSCRHINSCISI